MLFIFSMAVIIRHLWQLKTVVFLHWCLIHALLFANVNVKRFKFKNMKKNLFKDSACFISGMNSDCTEEHNQSTN